MIGFALVAIVAVIGFLCVAGDIEGMTRRPR
jgi:hypothetical protein